MVRLWPKFAVAAAPEYVIDVRPTAPMAVIASSMVVFASCARAITGRSAQTNAVAADVFRIRGTCSGQALITSREITGRERAIDAPIAALPPATTDTSIPNHGCMQRSR